MFSTNMDADDASGIGLCTAQCNAFHKGYVEFTHICFSKTKKNDIQNDIQHH